MFLSMVILQLMPLLPSPLSILMHPMLLSSLLLFTIVITIAVIAIYTTVIIHLHSKLEREKNVTEQRGGDSRGSSFAQYSVRRIGNLMRKKEAEGILLRGGVIFKGVLINDGGRPKLNYFRSYVVSLGVFLFY